MICSPQLLWFGKDLNVASCFRLVSTVCVCECQARKYFELDVCEVLECALATVGNFLKICRVAVKCTV